MDIDRDLKYFTPKQVQISRISYLILSDLSFGFLYVYNVLSDKSIVVLDIIWCPKVHLVS